MIMAHRTHCYFDYAQGLADDPFQYMGRGLSLKKVYSYDPYEGVPDSARKHVLGGQCCLWGEFIWNPIDFSWKMWPRALAMAEILWSYPRDRDFVAFAQRATVHRDRLVRRGYVCAPMPEMMER